MGPIYNSSMVYARYSWANLYKYIYIFIFIFIILLKYDGIDLDLTYLGFGFIYLRVDICPGDFGVCIADLFLQ